MRPDNAIDFSIEAYDSGEYLPGCNGKDVAMLTTSGRAPYPLAGYVGDRVIPFVWQVGGMVPPGTTSDWQLYLVPKGPKSLGWYNVYRDKHGNVWPTRERADTMALSDRIACVEIFEGQGLDQPQP